MAALLCTLLNYETAFAHALLLPCTYVKTRKAVSLGLIPHAQERADTLVLLQTI